MVPRYLLDTDICIYLRRSDRPQIRARFASLQADEAAISVITHGELTYGALKSSGAAQAMEGLARFVRVVPVLPLPQSASLTYGEIRLALAASGNLIGPNDLWIAAHALADGLILVTNNVREFKRVKGLKVENWAR